MTHLKGSAILILAFVMLLAACGGTASSVTPTATAAALVKGEFVGDAGRLAGIGLSTNPLPGRGPHASAELRGGHTA